MGARPKLTQKRRTQMLEAAAEIIGERGLCDTRIADIAERAGLSPALVVYYFGSKEKVLTEALAYAEDHFYIEAFRELTGIEGASEKLVRLIELACPAVERSEIDEYWALSLQGLLHDSAVSSELINEMCLDAAAQQLGFDPDALGRRGEEGATGLEELAAEG